MRCSCRSCGVYMVQEERGLTSGCRCPACGARCRDCMGTAQEPLSPEALRTRFAQLPLAGARFSSPEEAETEGAEESLADWRKYL